MDTDPAFSFRLFSFRVNETRYRLAFPVTIDGVAWDNGLKPGTLFADACEKPHRCLLCVLF